MHCMSNYVYDQPVVVISHSYIREAPSTASAVKSEIAGGIRVMAANPVPSGDPQHPEWLPVKYVMGGGITVEGFIAKELVAGVGGATTG